MRLLAPKTLLALTLTVFTAMPAAAVAGLFDDMLNKAKQAAQDAYQDTLDAASGSEKESTATQPSTAQGSSPKPSNKPTYDPVLVRQIQERLNQLGHNAGAPDGLYGSGTKKAIESFQARRGITVDGVPSPSLLAELKEAQQSGKVTASVTSSGAGIESDLPAGSTPGTSRLNIARAVVSIAPEKFRQRPDNELKRLAGNFFPDQRSKINSDEFYWQENKGYLVDKMVAESKGAPRTFEVAPWLNNAPEEGLSDSYNVNIIAGKYDFKRQALPIHYQVGPKNIRLPWIDGMGYRIVDAISQSKTYWLELPTDKAKALRDQLSGTNNLQGRYRFTIIDVVGFEPEKHPDFKAYEKYYKMGGNAKASVLYKLTPVALVQIEENKIEVYAQKKPGIAKSPHSFDYLTSLDISAGAQVASADNETAAAKKATAVSKNLTGFASADILGIGLGMPINEAVGIIMAHRSDLEKRPSPEKVKKSRPWEPYTNFVHFVAPDNSELIGLYTEPPAAGNRVTQVSRTLFIPPDQPRPKYDAVIASLIKKYGEPVYRLECEDCENHTSTFTWLNWAGSGALPKKTIQQCRQPSTIDATFGHNRLMGQPGYTDPGCPEKIIARVDYQRGNAVSRIQLLLTNTAQIAEYAAENERQEKTAREQAVGAPVPVL